MINIFIVRFLKSIPSAQLYNKTIRSYEKTRVFRSITYACSFTSYKDIETNGLSLFYNLLAFFFLHFFGFEQHISVYQLLKKANNKY